MARNQTDSGPVTAAQSAGATSEPIARLLMQVTDDAPNLHGLLVGYVRKDGAAAVRYTPMSRSQLNDLARMLEVKVQREYAQAIWPHTSAPPVRTAIPVHGPAPTRKTAAAPASPKPRARRTRKSSALSTADQQQETDDDAKPSQA